MFFASLNYFSCVFRVPLDLMGFSRKIFRVCGNMYLDFFSGGGGDCIFACAGDFE